MNGPGRGHYRWQHLPVAFEVYSDGIDLVIFEEFGAGRAALHLQDELERNSLLSDPAYRREFRVDYEKKFAPRVWHRDFYDARIVECPDASVVGKTIGAVADERGLHVVDTFLDLVVEHGKAMRWCTTITNARPEVLEKLAQQPGIQIGFSDAGAHLRNMAFYNFGIRFLRRVHERASAGHPFLTLERAVHMLTGDLGEFFGIDAGRLRLGDRADLVVIDPAGLDASTDEYHEAPLAEFGGLRRMVNRNDAAVTATVIGGRTVYRAGEFVEGYGRDWRSGRVLRAGEVVGSVDPRLSPTASCRWREHGYRRRSHGCATPDPAGAPRADDRPGHRRDDRGALRTGLHAYLGHRDRRAGRGVAGRDLPSLRDPARHRGGGRG